MHNWLTSNKEAYKAYKVKKTFLTRLKKNVIKSTFHYKACSGSIKSDSSAYIFLKTDAAKLKKDQIEFPRPDLLQFWIYCVRTYHGQKKTRTNSWEPVRAL